MEISQKAHKQKPYIWPYRKKRRN